MKNLLDQYLLAFQTKKIPQNIRDIFRRLDEYPAWSGQLPENWYASLNEDQRLLAEAFTITALIVRENYKHSPNFKERISIVSYPRSGNTFTRYIFEKLTNYKSVPYTGWTVDGISEPGWFGWDESGIITKFHFIGEFCKTDSLLRGNKKEKVVLLLRNPVENFLRDSPEDLKDWLEKPPSPRYDDNFDRFAIRGEMHGLGPGTGGDARVFGNFEYFRNIGYWLRLPEDNRCLLTYEELVEDPKSFVTKAHSIVENPVMSVEEFMKDYDKHFETARLLYSNKLGETARSSGKSVDKYSKETNKEMVQRIWTRAKEQSQWVPGVLQLLEELYEERNKS